MKSGPPRTPTRLKLLAGNPGKQKLHPELEPVPPSAEPVQPTWLTAEGRRCWRRATDSLREMGLLSVADGEVIAAFCSNWTYFVQANKALERIDVAARKEGAPEANPEDRKYWAQTLNECHMRLLRSAEHLGLTPSARSRIHVPGGTKRKDEFGSFLEEGSRAKGEA